MTPAEDQLIRANMIAIFTKVVLPVCVISSIVQLRLLSRTGAFARVRQLIPATVASAMLTIPLMFAFGWLEGRLPGAVLQGMYASLRLMPTELQFAYVIIAPAAAAAVVAYTFVGRVALRRARRPPASDPRGM